METLQRTANRGSISTGYDIDNSAVFSGANGIQFNPSSDGNRKTWTVSLWLKRSELSTETTIFGSQNTVMVLMDPDWFRFTLYNGTTTYYFDTETNGPRYRDTSAWYNFVFQCDTTQGTASDRAKLWVNGESVTNTNSNTIPQNAEFDLNDNTKNIQVGYFYAGNEQLDGYLSEIHFTDGVANDADAFGEYDNNSGIWKPKAYAGSYGTNGFYLEFKEPAASATGIGKDTSGNGHNFSTGGAYPSQATDTPTNNFCIMNMLDRTNGNSKNQEGATKVTTDGGSGWCSMVATMGVTKGKWYWEAQRSGGSSDSNDVVVGIVADSDPYIPYSSAAQYYIGNVAESSSIGFYTTGSPNVRNGSGDSISNSAGDIIMVGLDMDNGKIYFGVNGTWDGLGTGGSTLWSSFDNQFVLPAVAVYQGKQIKINFGGYASYTISSAASDANGYGTFEYAPPSGYYALSSQNLALYG